tara:strand:+ start:5184 stop:6089 length:906 start_codon:yes stop_codon:yes gene_type:complete
MKRPGRYRSLKSRKRESDYKEWASELYNDTLTNLKLDKLRQICIENGLSKSGNKSKLSERIKKNLTYKTHEFVREEKNVKIKCYRYDYISFMIGSNSNFYEISVLKAVEEIFPKEGIAIDIGGHVGNHSMFFLMFCSAKKCYVFEPREDLKNLIEENASLNDVKNRLTVNLKGVKGISNKKQKLSLEPVKDFNLGTGKLLKSGNREIAVDSVDNLFKEEHIDLIKIDVEGLEERVLEGALKTIGRCKPVLVVETNIKSDEEEDHLAAIDRILNIVGSSSYKIHYRDGSLPGPYTYVLRHSL